MRNKLIFFLISINQIITYFEESHMKGTMLKVGLGQLKSVETHLPFKYDYLKLCNPENPRIINDNLGELLLGHKIRESNYEIILGKEEHCKILCTAEITSETIIKFKWLLEHSYSMSLYLDNLPAARGYHDIAENKTFYYYSGGIPFGQTLSPDDYSSIFIYNHLTFKVNIHKLNNEDLFEIVGFSVFPSSIQHTDTSDLACKNNLNFYEYDYTQIPQVLQENSKVIFTYDVIFELSNLTMVSRWDRYLHLKSDIHWFGLLNSNLIILIITFVLIFIFCRAIKKDIDIYNVKVTGDEFIDEYGWKQVCNDVFRRPINTMMLCTLTGTGIQLFMMVFISLLISIIGILRPESRSSLITFMLIDFVLMGILGGYVSSRMYKMLKGKSWLKNALLTSLFYPSLLFLMGLIINFLFFVEGSDAALSIIEILSLLLLWLCCLSPLVLIGSFFGIKQKIYKIPCRINPCPTSIPNKPWYFKIKYLVWITGLIPFAAIFVEFLYLMASLWRDQIYYLFGFLWLALLVLIIISSEMSIIVCFICLCFGDYNWWWKSFFIGASPTIYFFGYSVYYFQYLNTVRFSTILIYFGAMGILSSLIFLICGSLGVFSTFSFLVKIYSLIKVD